MAEEILPGITLPENLSLQERSDFIRSALRVDVARFINAGASANQAYESYQAAGLGIHRQQFLRLYREEKAYIGNLNPAGQLAESDTVSDFQRTVSSYRLETNYRERVSMVYFDKQTGELKRTVFNFDHDNPMTVGQTLDYARSAFTEGSYQGYEFEVVAVSLEDSLIQAGLI